MVVVAAGGIVWRQIDGSEVLAVIHRPHRQDWSLPKGKLEAGETPVEAAEREVTEETGLDIEVAEALGTVTYVDHRDRRKVVHYWSMRWIGGEFASNSEADSLVWVDAEAAAALLTHDTDREVLRRCRSDLGHAS